MAWIIKRKGWEIPEREATPEAAYINRRRFMKALGITGLGTIGGLATGCGSEKGFTPFDNQSENAAATTPPIDVKSFYPATRNPGFTLDRDLTDERIAGSYNNFYEFSVNKGDVQEQAERFAFSPWLVDVRGLVQKPMTFNADDLVRKIPLEERLYRHRCVEAWAMAIPWTGFPMKALMDLVEPLSSAKYVKMTTFLNPGTAPGQFNTPQWPWPYVEALTMQEAANDLTMLVTGIYGKPLPSQHGPPIRLVVPWKYGFKSIKSIVQIDFVAERPATFWNTLVPEEYGFTANVNPTVPHPRWSQATEWMISAEPSVERRPTLLYNGYGEQVAHLY